MWRRGIFQIIVYLGLFLLSSMALAPLVWGILTSFKPDYEIFRIPIQWWPANPTIAHYERVLSGSIAKGNMLRSIINSIIVSCSAAVFSTVCALACAYATARLKSLGGYTFLIIVLLASMVPTIAILIPLFFLTNWLHIYDTYLGLIFVHTALRIPFSAWLLHGFLQELPWELEEAALVDGCSKRQAFLLVILPLLRPGIAATLLLAALYVWQDFLIGFTLTQSSNLRVATVALYDYLSQFGVQWGELMAATTLTAVPLMLAFYAFQRQIIEGLAGGSVKQ
jgi:ABC-type glycerol-3-phosphate transport system permease component